jgi:hypothetical protein
MEEAMSDEGWQVMPDAPGLWWGREGSAPDEQYVLCEVRERRDGGHLVLPLGVNSGHAYVSSADSGMAWMRCDAPDEVREMRERHAAEVAKARREGAEEMRARCADLAHACGLSLLPDAIRALPLPGEEVSRG